MAAFDASVERGEASGALWGASAVAAGMIAQQVAGKVARDALFLSNFPATYLPRAVVAAALLSLLAVLATSRLLARAGPRRIVPAAFAVNGALYAVEWGFAPYAPGMVASAIYLHTAAIGGVVISGFWSVVNERFDPHTARYNVARITTGATLGGLLGGLAAERVGVWLDPRHILVLLAVVNVASAVGVARVARGVRVPAGGAPASLAQGFAPLATSRYLASVAFVVVAVALLEVFLEYALKAKAADVHTDEKGLVSFFALFYTVAAFATFVVQVGFANKSLDKLGLGGTLALGPALVVVGAVGAALHFELWTIALATGVQSVVANSVFRSAYELLYTPVDPTVKRPIKVVIDVALGRVGSMIASGVILLLVALAWPTDLIVIALAAVFGLVALVVCLGLHRGYVHELAQSLQSGIVALDEKDVVDATTRQTLASTTMALDRERLLAEIEALRETGSAANEPAVVAEAVRRVADDGAADAWLESVRIFATGTSERIRAHLDAGPLDPRVAAFVIPLLARNDGELVAAVSYALEAQVERLAGQLTDAYLDPEAPIVVRRRLPRVLRASDDARVVDALLRGLADEDFDVRYFTSRTLDTITERGTPIPIAPAAAFALASAELTVDDSTWRRRFRLKTDPPRREGVHRGLEHVFAILGLALERDVVRLALGALEGTDPRLRGTALEYLENVLPPELAKQLFARTEHRPAPTPKRSTQDVAEDLRKSATAITFDRAELDGQS